MGKRLPVAAIFENLEGDASVHLQSIGIARASLRPAAMRGTMTAMQVLNGTVVGGRIVVEGEPPPEGTLVTILAREPEKAFEIPPELEADLLESITQADRGEAAPLDEVLRRLRSTV